MHFSCKICLTLTRDLHLKPLSHLFRSLKVNAYQYHYCILRSTKALRNTCMYSKRFSLHCYYRVDKGTCRLINLKMGRGDEQKPLCTVSDGKSILISDLQKCHLSQIMVSSYRYVGCLQIPWINCNENTTRYVYHNTLTQKGI